MLSAGCEAGSVGRAVHGAPPVFNQTPEKTGGGPGLNCINLVSLPCKNWQRLCQTSEKNQGINV